MTQANEVIAQQNMKPWGQNLKLEEKAQGKESSQTRTEKQTKQKQKKAEEREEDGGGGKEGGEDGR